MNTLVVIPNKYLKDQVTSILSIDDEEMKNKIYVALTRATGETCITSRKNILNNLVYYMIFFTIYNFLMYQKAYEGC